MGTENIDATPSQKHHHVGDTDDVIFIPVTIDEHNVIEGAREILKVIRPTWSGDNIKFKLFTDGITNKLVGCFYKPPLNNNESTISSRLPRSNITSIETECSHMQPDEEGAVESQSDDEVILVRVYGNKTDLLIDRKAEFRNIQRLHRHGFAPNVYGIFHNGLAYEYLPGVTLTSDTVIDPHIWPLIARHMAKMHRLDIGKDDQEGSSSSCRPQPMLKSKTEQFLDLVPDQFSDSAKHERVKATFLPVQRLRDEFNELNKHLAALNSPTVFAHNDLLLGNVIYTESQSRVSFIDFEYADHNYQAFDIGNHFNEFAGIDDIDYSRYPSKKFQYEWLKCYLQAYNGTDDVSDGDIEKLYTETNVFALASNFFWAIWGLIQAEHSTIDFDFILFAENRYNEYLARKDEFLSLIGKQ